MAKNDMSPSEIAAQISRRKDGAKIAKILADGMDGVVTLPKSAFGAFGYLAKNNLGAADKSGKGFEFATNARGKRVFSELSGIMDTDMPMSIPKAKKAPAKAKRGPGRPRKSDSVVAAIEEIERSIPKSKKKATAKRGPGRPRKRKSDMGMEGLMEALGPARRGPGRPRKSDSIVEAIAAVERDIPKSKKKATAKRGPGRPRKSEMVLIEDIAPVKRGPGRPRKEMTAKQEERLIAQTAAKLQKTATAIQACAIVLGRRGGHAKYGTVPPYEYTSRKRGGAGPSDDQIREEMKAIRAMFK